MLIVPLPVIAIPRLAFKVKPAVVFKVPPLKTIEPEVALDGTPPKLPSEEIVNVPALIVVPPV